MLIQTRTHQKWFIYEHEDEDGEDPHGKPSAHGSLWHGAWLIIHLIAVVAVTKVNADPLEHLLPAINASKQVTGFLVALLIVTLMSGLLLIIMGQARFGRLIEFIPLPVTLGFTSGIAITIGTMQIKDFFGLHTAPLPEHYLGKVANLLSALPTFAVADTLVGIVTLGVLIYWPRPCIRLPPHLPALLAGVAVMCVLWVLGLPAAFSMAMLGAIESLLCAVVLDGMTGKKHQSDNELIGQGIDNVLAPFFGGITATAPHPPSQRWCMPCWRCWCSPPRFPGCRYPPWRPCCCWSPGT